jgi:hypothetical protein
VNTRYLRFNSRAAGELKRAPLLERLLARADPAPAGGDWRADAYGALAASAPMPGIAAARFFSLHRQTRVSNDPAPAPPQPAATSSGAWLYLATPLHYLAELSNVRLNPAGILTLEAAESASLARDFNRLWSDSAFRLEAVGPTLFCRTQRALNAAQCDPERALGRHIEEFLPTGEHAGTLKRLMSEMEMWLFDHEVNRARARRMVPPISGLWLWGGGATLHSLPATRHGAAGDDVFFSAFAAERTQPENVIVVQDVPGTEAWRSVQSHWLQPALDDLQRGVIVRLDLSSDARCWHLGRHWRRRLFRRGKPWWEYFD